MAHPPSLPDSSRRIPELTVVMPVHDEQQTIVEVVSAWTAELDDHHVDYELVVYDDGSTDDTRQRLDELTSTLDRLVVVEQPNAGHGPTLMRGYREARGDWVFQVDSDGELSTGQFDALWHRRDAYDFLIGSRRGTRAPLLRRLVSLAARWTVRALFVTEPPRDVNCPFRLMRRRSLSELLPYVRSDAFAPNVTLSGLAAAAGLRVHEAPVNSLPRVAGESSLRGHRLIRAALASAWQTLVAARRFRSGRSATPVR